MATAPAPTAGTTTAPHPIGPPSSTGDHRNQVVYKPDEWLQSLIAIKGRALPLAVIGAVAASSAVLLAIVVFGTGAGYENCEDDDDGECRAVIMSSAAHTFVGIAAFFLLGFRANASNDRFYEGRKQWGMVINRTRDLSRQIVTYLPDADSGVEGGSTHRRACGFVVAFAVTMKRHLRDERGELGELRDVLSQEDCDAIAEAKHMPLYVLDVLSSYIERARSTGAISDIVAQTLDNNVTGYNDYLGACERIKKTPMPYAYVVHLRTALVLWLTTLPLVLWTALGWMSILACVVVAYLLLGIEAMGVEIENPFGHDANDLPLGSINDTIKGNVKEILSRSRRTPSSGHASDPLLVAHKSWTDDVPLAKAV